MILIIRPLKKIKLHLNLCWHKIIGQNRQKFVKKIIALIFQYLFYKLGST